MEKEYFIGDSKYVVYDDGDDTKVGYYMVSEDNEDGYTDEPVITVTLPKEYLNDYATAIKREMFTKEDVVTLMGVLTMMDELAKRFNSEMVDERYTADLTALKTKLTELSKLMTVEK